MQTSPIVFWLALAASLGATFGFASSAARFKQSRDMRSRRAKLLFGTVAAVATIVYLGCRGPIPAIGIFSRLGLLGGLLQLCWGFYSLAIVVSANKAAQAADRAMHLRDKSEVPHERYHVLNDNLRVSLSILLNAFILLTCVAEANHLFGGR